MYKEEGNEVMKTKKTKKDLQTARDLYSYALSFIDKAHLDEKLVATSMEEIKQLHSGTTFNLLTLLLSTHAIFFCLFLSVYCLFYRISVLL